jgi:photosynthetic reaction center cytochrome c subunit
MTLSRGTVLTLFSCVLSATVAAQDIPRTKPVNLQVLPKETSSASVGKLMKRFEKELGVSCSHCHVEDPQTQKLDYASDENPRKQTARLMIAMLDDINNKYLAQLGSDRRYAVPVTCGSCHQGQSSPPAFEPRSRL